MANPRDTPLEQCPDPVCRRSGLCRSTYADEPCRRFFMSDDEWREDFACLLDRLYVEYTGDPGALSRPQPEPSPEEWAILYNALAARAAETTHAELLPKWARRRT